MPSATTMTFPPLPLNIGVDKIKNLLDNLKSRELLLKQVSGQFEQKYQCSLEQFETKIDNLELPEHPCWEESIEWRNAIEQTQQIQLIWSILKWLTDLLRQF